MGGLPNSGWSWLWSRAAAGKSYLRTSFEDFTEVSQNKKGIISIQGVTTGEELSSGMAFMVFTQALFPAIVLVLCNLILVSSLKTELPRHAPNVDVAAVIQAGATNFRSIVGATDLDGVIVAWANSVDRVFYLVAALVTVSGLFIWGIGWQDLRKKVQAPGSTDTNVSVGGEKGVDAGNRT